MIRHILLIRFQEKITAEQISVVKTMFLSIPSCIPGVDSVEWGENNSPEGKNAGYTHCVMITFADEKARQRYLPHPDHKAIQSVFRQILSNIIVFDYELMRK
ncbi:Dabb family protein [Escherichia coli]|uniref:Dabb family protein n=1 Tax=Escherichia coli TaxID=562 RepID=UPI00124F6790|nr:Dabb family protein [Escherichia coli]KAB2827033.1 Dabb family protein [Escherichia coli]HDD9400506.1 Dabb family protein [Escherichia coli]